MKKVVIPVEGFQQTCTATAMAAFLGLNRVVHSQIAYRTFIILIQTFQELEIMTASLLNN